MLPLNARGCVACGASTVSRLPRELVNGNRNHIEYESSTTRNSLKADLTDSAIENMSDAILALMTQRGLSVPQRHHRPARSEIIDAPIRQLPLESQVEDTSYDAKNDSLSKNGVTGEANSHIAQLQSIFLINGDKYKLQNPQIKATSASDFCKRAGCLLLYAHELRGGEWVDRSDLYELFKECKVEDNSRHWLANGEELMKGENSTLRLSVPGRTVAVETLNRILDPTIESSWSLQQHTAGRTNRPSKGSDGSGENPRAGSGRKQSSLDVAAWVSGWKSKFPEVPAHELLSEKSLWEIAICALRAVECSSGSIDINVTREQLAQFAIGAFDIKRPGRSFERALKEQKNAKTMVLHVGGTTFRLNPKGRKAADEILRLDQVTDLIAFGVSSNGDSDGAIVRSDE